MSPQSSKPAEPDIYVGMLSLSVTALLIGLVFLIVELYQYAWQLPS